MSCETLIVAGSKFAWCCLGLELTDNREWMGTFSLLQLAVVMHYAEFVLLHVYVAFTVLKQDKPSTAQLLLFS